MDKNLPLNYRKIAHISPDISSVPNILLYYVLLGVLVVAALFSSKYIGAVVPANSAIAIQPSAVQDIWWLLLFMAIYFSGVPLHFLLSFSIFGLYGTRAIYRSRRMAPSGRHQIKSLIPTWLSSVWAPDQAFSRNKYLLIVIVPLVGTLLALYGLAYLSQLIIVPGLGFQFVIAILFELVLYANRLFLLVRLLLFPATAYFVDSQNGLYVYDHG